MTLQLVNQAISAGVSVTVKLDAIDRARLSSLAARKKRTPHYLMKAAILDYVRVEEARQNFIEASVASFEQFKETGQHITLDEFNAWADDLPLTPDAPVPPCHG